MRINDTMMTNMYNELEENKQVSKLAFDENKFRDWCYTINHVGGLNYRIKTLGDYLLSDYQIPEAMKELVIPRKISVADGDEFKDLKKDSVYGKKVKNVTDGKLLEADEFSTVSKAICNSMRKSNAAMTDLGTASKAVVYSTVQSRTYANETHCLREDSIYVPIILGFDAVDTDFLGTKNDVMFKLWFKAACDAISRG